MSFGDPGYERDEEGQRRFQAEVLDHQDKASNTVGRNYLIRRVSQTFENFRALNTEARLDAILDLMCANALAFQASTSVQAGKMLFEIMKVTGEIERLRKTGETKEEKDLEREFGPRPER